MAGEDSSSLLPEMPTGQDTPPLVPEPRRTGAPSPLPWPSWRQRSPGLTGRRSKGCVWGPQLRPWVPGAWLPCLLPAPGSHRAPPPQCKAVVSPSVWGLETENGKCPMSQTPQAQR